MPLSNIAAQAEKALALIMEGRQMITRIADAVRDGKEGTDAKTLGELNALLAKEQTESQAAHDSLARLITIAKSQ